MVAFHLLLLITKIRDIKKYSIIYEIERTHTTSKQVVAWKVFNDDDSNHCLAFCESLFDNSQCLTMTIFFN